MTSSEYLSASDGRYICSVCGTDITKALRRWIPGHGGPKIGRENVPCKCGKSYKTGATEWDHMSLRTKRNQIRGLLWGLLFVPGFLSCIGASFGFLTNGSAHNAKYGFLIGLIPGLAFMAFMLINFNLDLLASIRRTRSGAGIVR